MTEYDNTFFCDFTTLTDEVIMTGVVTLGQVECRFIIDYQNMDMTTIELLVATLENQQELYKSENCTFSVPALEVLQDYAEEASQLRYIMLMLDIPVILMLVFYLYMVSQLHIESEKNEIAMYKSRGASRWQIVKIYALETLILGGIAGVVGPFVGLLLCRIIGVSNGFLEFVNRTALATKLSLSAFLYSFLAVGVFFLTTLGPAIKASNTTIVEHKQSKAHGQKKPLWQRGYFDIIMIVGTVAWLFWHNYQEDVLISQGVTDTSATMNPLMFAASTVFILGCALLCVRIYPYFIRLIYRIGRKHWSPAAYISMNNLSRSSTGRESFIMIFLILTVALGIFSANTARAINKNTEDRISYNLGADAVLEENWKYSRVTVTNDEGEEETVAQYTEPDFIYEDLDGVEVATPVLNRENAQLRYNDSTKTGIDLMAIVPEQFAEVCWFRDDLLPVHINYYINALSECTNGIIVSTSYQEKTGVQLGDVVEVKWSSNDWFEAVVVAVVDYWPTFNPLDKNSSGEYQDFVIMNYNYVTIQTSLEPYEVWMKLSDDAVIADLYQSVEDAGITLTRLDVASQLITSSKTDAILQGVNGALTLGFITIMAMCFIGFLIYWILSIRERTLQFGILRAMGMSFREIASMLIYEQILVSGVSIFLAIIIGGITSDLFVPLFQVLYNVTDQVPPFVVSASRSDYIKLYVIIGVMLVVGFLVIARLVKKININKALKLGEV